MVQGFVRFHVGGVFRDSFGGDDFFGDVRCAGDFGDEGVEVVLVVGGDDLWVEWGAGDLKPRRS